MARPVKNYCDYFSHDRDMRNHRKLKAVRTKFGIAGYGIWCMTLEYLTGIDGNVIEFTENEIELMSGDYGVSAPEIRDVLNYCVKLELLFLKDGFLHSDSLNERLKPVYDKRGVSKDNSKKQHRTNGKFTGNNTDTTVVSGAETPQSKVKESKVKESIQNQSADILKKWEEMIVVEMMKVWKERKPGYAEIKNVDYPALLIIAYYIAGRKGWTQESVVNINEINVLSSWKTMVDFIVKDNFFCSKTLSTIGSDKMMQNLEESMKGPPKEGNRQNGESAEDIREKRDREFLQQAMKR